MTAPAVVTREPAWAPLAAAFHRFAAAAPHDLRAQAGLEAALEALFALAARRGRGALRSLEALLAEAAGRHAAIDAWRALAHVHLARTSTWRQALDALDPVLASAPPRTAWLAGLEAARVVWRRGGAAPAWSRAAALDAVEPVHDWRSDSPMVASALLTKLGLAAATGAWDTCDAIARTAVSTWPADHPAAVRVGLALADHAIQRGRYRDALARLERLDEAARGDLRAHLLCARLHALVGLGLSSEKEVRATFRALRKALRAARFGGHEMPADERRALRRRAAQIARQAGLIESPGRRVRPTGLPGLLRLASEARGKKGERREQALLEVLRHTETMIGHAAPITSPEAWIRLQLLWCRLVVDLDDRARFDACEEVLDRLVDDAARHGFAPLEMLAFDQRALIRARRSAMSWRGAVEDSTRAATIAMELLATNTDASGAGRPVERSLLEDLLPIFDRVIQLHVEGALRVAARHPALLATPLGAYREILDEESPRGTWVRFGRVLHSYAEQSQALALEEARRAYGDGRTIPHRFAMATQGEASVILDALCDKLRPGDGVLQYLVCGRHVLVFAYGRGFFDWHVTAIPETDGPSRPHPAHRELDDLLRALRGWSQGESHPEQRAALEALHALLLPDKIDAALASAGVCHLRVVPHDVLYQVPFGRLATREGPLAHRFSMSLHPSGQLAAESAEGARARPARRPVLGFILGPGVDCAAQEELSVRRGAGTVAPLARVEHVDGASAALKEVLARLPDFDLLHFLCHGQEGGGFRQSPALSIGGEEGSRLELPRLLGLQLRRSTLVVLQSCWTGWMDHRRTDPVQGFPQAFCDAGAGAVIAPLTQIPQALTPFFSDVLYRTLRFLPAEQALHRTLEVLRIHGDLLVARDPRAREVLGEHGSMDVFEYRYTGATGLLLNGFFSRCAGRLSFWWWEWRLRRARMSRALGGVPAQPR